MIFKGKKTIGHVDWSLGSDVCFLQLYTTLEIASLRLTMKDDISTK
jgi:hypothetical protein